MLFDWTYIQSQDHLFFNHLTQTDGLSQTTNNVVYTDSRGFVWIGSSNGLNRYDGHRVKVYKYQQDDTHSLPDNYIQSCFFEDDIGDLWFTTYEALVQYVRKHDHFERYPFHNEKGKPMIGYFLAFQQDKQVLGVVVEGNKWYLFDTATKQYCFEHDLPKGTHRVMPLRNKKDEITGLFTFNYDSPGIHFLPYNTATGLPIETRFTGKNGEPSIRPTDFLAEGDSLLRVSAREGFLAINLQNLQDWQFLPTTDWHPNDLNNYSNKELLLSTNAGWRRSPKDSLLGGTSFQYDPNNPWSLASNSTFGIRADRNGVIWVGVLGSGVDFSQPNKVKFGLFDIGRLWGITDRLLGVFGMAEGWDGNIYCASNNGVFKLSSNRQPLAHFTKGETAGKGLPTNEIRQLFFDDKKRLWAPTLQGLGVLEPGQSDFKTLPANGGFLNGIELKNGRGVLFSALKGGIFKLEENGKDMRLERLPQVDSTGAYTHLFQDRKGLLFACRDLNLIEIRNPEQVFSIIEKLPIKGDVRWFYEMPNSSIYWIGTSNGLVKFDLNTCHWETLTEADGLPDQHIYTVAGDAAGTLWMTTNRGLVRFCPDPDERRFHAFDVPDGLQGLEFNSFGYLRRRNGEFWFAGQNGINFFHPDSIKMLPILPKVQLTRLLVNNMEVPHPICRATGATNISEVKKLVFNHNENTLNFEFAALEFSNPSKNQFRYKLENYESDWSPVTMQGFARYANLPPGRYFLKVIAANSDGIWSAEKQLEIVIKRPFWLQWWFLLLALSAAGTSGYGIYRWRIGQLLGVERLRNQISIDLHDDIGATLSNVNILTTLIRQKLPTDSEALPLLDRIEEEVQASAESLDDIIWSINPKNDPLDRVLARMRRFATEVFEAKGIEGTLQFPPEAKRLRLTMEKRRHFYLFFKEAINNLTKYSNCRNAIVSVVYQKGQLTVSVSDDGVGFDPNTAKEGGNGLMTMRQRAKSLRGEFSLKSAPGQGTTVGIRFPVTENRD